MESAFSPDVRRYRDCSEHGRRKQELLSGRVQGPFHAEDALGFTVRTWQCLAASMHDTMIGPHALLVSTSPCLPTTSSAAAGIHEA
jgi:hypothetical protein